MYPLPHHIDRAQNVTKECDTTFPATRSRRTSSISSSSSFSSCSSSNFPDEFPSSPATPLRFSGVPFSWEHLPGIPKMYCKKKRDQSPLSKVLPLPPQVSKRLNLEEIGIQKGICNESLGMDPFFAALVECSKEEGHMVSGKVSRSISDRFGFINLYTSCKRSCGVSESIVHLPRSKTSYSLIGANNHHLQNQL
ncbi:uncharacterized protein [Euphorbia lathyris]|uniref:uncharacterized protein n=1 Tax=Euphorbia lathyris TaxID=212925 RepID=UPI003313D760